jgi:hypothetical protein
VNPFIKLETLAFEDFQKVITNSLKTRLVNLKIQKVQEIITSLEQILIKNQSLITIPKI